MNQATLQQVLCRPEYGPKFSYMLSASPTFSFFQLQSVIFSSESSTRHANLSSSTTSQQWHHSWTLIFICRGLPKLFGCAPATARKGCPKRAGNPMIDCYTCKLVPHMRSVHRVITTVNKPDEIVDILNPLVCLISQLTQTFYY